MLGSSLSRGELLNFGKVMTHAFAEPHLWSPLLPGPGAREEKQAQSIERRYHRDGKATSLRLLDSVWVIFFGKLRKGAKERLQKFGLL